MLGCYAVTGGAGFIGSHIALRLARDGHEVRVVDDLSTGSRENLEGAGGKLRVIEGDICDGAALRQAFDGADCVFHQAALASVPRSVDDPAATNRVNVDGTLHVLQAARDRGVRRIVYASSSSVYGDSPTLPKCEDMLPAPMSPYAVTKLAGEHYCAAFTEVFGLEAVSLRYFNIFGPRQDPHSQYSAVVPLFVTALLEGRRPTVFGDGEQSRDFTYVENAVEANLRAARAPGAPGMAFNVGCGRCYTLNELLQALGAILGCEAQADYAEPRAGDVRHSMADITRARTVLGFEPLVGFEEGLRRTVEWYKGRAQA